MSMNKLLLVIIVLFGLGLGAYLASVLPSRPSPPNPPPPTAAENTPIVAPVSAPTGAPPSPAATTPPPTPGQSMAGVQLKPDEALKIAQASVCLKEGSLTGQQFHNDQTKTWWLDLGPKQPRPGCSPACVVYDVTRAAEINWRCTGALPPAR